MSYPPDINKYLEKSLEIKKWGLSSQVISGVSIAVVIPVLAEMDELFKTLLSLSKNNPTILAKTLLICVVNNRDVSYANLGDIDNNANTLATLKVLERGDNLDAPEFDEVICKISSSSLNIACIDASSPGRELPDKEGVGTARKIGMDVALSLFDYKESGDKVLVCLDADTRVEENYLEAIQKHFSKENSAVAVIDYSHRMPEDERGAMAAAAYELYLRYYEAGLAMAASPYAYHTIGSTMTCTAKAYVATGGMNRRMAGEDFYFLQKLAKYGSMERITDTTVYPAGRVSNRVPFGTGKKLGDMESECVTDFSLYHPDSFIIIKDFIELVQNSAQNGKGDGSQLLCKIGKVNFELKEYLIANNFVQLWDKLKRNSSSGKQLIRHFHNWFDGFRTLKLVHYLRDNSLPNLPMFDAIEQMLKLMGLEAEGLPERVAMNLKARLDLLEHFRGINNLRFKQ